MTRNTRFAVFKPGDTIEIELQVSGGRTADDHLLWQLKDYRGGLLEQGEFEVPRGNEPVTCKVSPADHRSGCFELHARLEKSNVTLPHLGTRPSGVITYGVLPGINAMPLKSPEQSRFGVQGTTFCSSGRRLSGDSYNPYYSVLGVKWLYISRRLQELQRAPEHQFTPKLTEAELKYSNRHEANGRFAPLWDLHSIPAWMMKSPTPIKNPERKSPSHFCQKYPPRDYKAYGLLLEKVASELNARSKYIFPYMKHNYYQIHWEPDWHWLGTEEEFIEIYKTAHAALHKVDPNAVLTGANYGVISKGNLLLESLLKKGLGKYLDGITTHAYSTKWLSPEKSGLIEDMAKLVELTRKYLKPGAPIFQTEWGVNWQGDFSRQDVPREKLLCELAWNMRAHTIILGEGANSTWFFYASDLSKRGFGLAYNLDFPTYGCGPVNISPKPVTMGISTLTRVLEGTQSLGRIDYLGDGIIGYLFKRGKEVVLVIWSGDEQTRSIILDTGALTIKHVNCMGNAKEIKCENGKLELLVGAVPQFIIGVNPEIIPSVAPVRVLQGETMDLNKLFTPVKHGGKLELCRGLKTVQAGAAGFRFSPEIVPGVWLLKQYDTNGVNALRAVPVEVCRRVSITTLKPRATGYIVAIANKSNAAVTGKLKLISGKFTGETVKVTIPAHKSSDVTLRFPAKLENNSISAVFTDTDGFRATKTVSTNSMLNAYDYGQAPPTIDGSLKEWQLENFTRMASAKDLAFKKAPWSGPDDLAVLYSIGYDNQNFYIALKVSDQSHFPPMKSREPWRGDSVQLAFGLGMDNSGNASAIKKFSFELDGNNKVIAKEMSNAPPVPPIVKRLLTAKDIQVAVRRDKENSVTLYEAAIPWRLISGSSAPDTFGLGVMINDSDNAEEVTQDARKTMLIGNGVGFFNHTMTFKTISTK